MTTPSSQAQSVHLQTLTTYQDIPFNKKVVLQMNFIRDVCSAALSIRKKHDIKARQPLQKITIYGNDIGFLSTMKNIIKDEINVKEVEIVEDLSTVGIKTVINIDAKAVAKRIGKDFQSVLKQAKAGIFDENENGIMINGYQIFKNEYNLNLEVGDTQNYASIDGKYLIVLDLTITKDLEMEGIARDFIRAIQNTRKTKNFDITDGVTLKVYFAENNLEKQAILKYADFISSQVLAKQFVEVDMQCANEFVETVFFDAEVLKPSVDIY